MRQFSIIALAGLLLVASENIPGPRAVSQASAQTPPGQQAPGKKKDAQAGKRAPRTEDDPLAAQRRATAR
jgi:hypothetical protein